MKRKKVELLAPAGGMRQVIAAVENGADAVYMGGSSFNARMGAENFTDEEMKAAIEYAHLRNVKVYITMNTLYTDSEVLAAAECAERYYEMGADALIIQDFGFGEYVRRLCPDFELHLSTQATIFNRRGVLKASEIGYSRVVPARELSLDEIRSLCSTETEIEVFVHGALCMCYSGQCQMSRRIGGRSGNRGACAQPCRLKYRIDGKEGYHLSPKDLCQLSMIPELIEAGVSSFKVEGRMKSPEYVAVVIRIYRKYIDMYYDRGYIDIDDSDMEKLMQIFSRNGFTHGYLNGYPGKKLLSGDIPKHSGIYVGKTLSSPDEFGIVDVRLSGELKQGDGAEIRGKVITGNIITYVREKKNGITAIGDIRADAGKGASVFRTSSIEQLKEARRTFEEGKCFRKISVDAVFDARIGEKPVLSISEGDNEVIVFGESICEPAVNRELDEGNVLKQLRKLGDTPFELEKLTCTIEDGLSLPVSSINAMRREAVEKLSELKKKGRDGIGFSYFGYESENIDEMGVFIYDTDDLYREDVRDIIPDMVPVFVKIDDFLEKKLPCGFRYIPYIPFVSKGKMDEYVEKNLDKISDASDSIMVNNLGWIDEFVSRNMRVYAGPGLNVYNGYSDEFIRSLGACACADSLENTDEKDGSSLLMATEYGLNGKNIVDRKNEAYEIYGDEASEKTYILKKRLPEMNNLSKCAERLKLIYI